MEELFNSFRLHTAEWFAQVRISYRDSAKCTLRYTCFIRITQIWRLCASMLVNLSLRSVRSQTQSNTLKGALSRISGISLNGQNMKFALRETLK